LPRSFAIPASHASGHDLCCPQVVFTCLRFFASTARLLIARFKRPGNTAEANKDTSHSIAV